MLVRVPDLVIGVGLPNSIEIAEFATELGSGLAWGTPKTHERRPSPWPHSSPIVSPHTSEQSPTTTRTERRPTPLLPFRQTVWIPAVKAAGLEQLRIHDLRGTAASLMISTGANIKAVQRQLGHASAAMTLDLYGHLYEDDLDTLSEALDRRYIAATAPRQTRPERGSSDSPAPLSRPEGLRGCRRLDGSTRNTLI